MAAYKLLNRFTRNVKELNYTKLFLELLVVFLGVTAGFLLQNQKEMTQNDELEQKYLAGFYTDVNLNITKLDSLIILDSIWVVTNTSALKQIAQDSFSIDSANALIMKMLSYSEYTKQTSTYENIINSSNLNLIKNYELKLQIVEYHKSLEDFTILEHYLKDFHTQHLIPYVLNNFDVFGRKLNDPEQRKSIYHKNLMGIYYSLINQRWEVYKELMIESTELRDALNSNLKEYY